jgi:hypothetical protein
VLHCMTDTFGCNYQGELVIHTMSIQRNLDSRPKVQGEFCDNIR